MKILIYGYGNPGRQDDAFGPVFVDMVEEWIAEEGITNIEVDSNYQLNIEDSEAISDKDLVIFVDASVEEIDSFILTKVEPSEAQIEFTMHAVSTSFVLDLCKKIYNKHPETYLLHIKGYEWDFMEGLSAKGKENLNLAFEFIKAKIHDVNLIREAVSK